MVLVYHLVYCIQIFYFIRYHVYKFILFGLSISCIFLIFLSNAQIRHFFSSRLGLSISYISSPSNLSSMFSCVSSFKPNFFFLLKDDLTNCMLDNSIVLLLFSKPFFNECYILCYLVGLLLVYLEPKLLMTLHSYGEFPGPLIIQVSFNQSFVRYTYLYLRLPALLLVSE